MSRPSLANQIRGVVLATPQPEAIRQCPSCKSGNGYRYHEEGDLHWYCRDCKVDTHLRKSKVGVLVIDRGPTKRR